MRSSLNGILPMAFASSSLDEDNDQYGTLIESLASDYPSDDPYRVVEMREMFDLVIEALRFAPMRDIEREVLELRWGLHEGYLAGAAKVPGVEPLTGATMTLAEVAQAIKVLTGQEWNPQSIHVLYGRAYGKFRAYLLERIREKELPVAVPEFSACRSAIDAA